MTPEVQAEVPDAAVGWEADGGVEGVGIHLIPILMDMGFSHPKCIQAVKVTKPTNIEVRIKKINKHLLT